jgi:hypothetical protein
LSQAKSKAWDFPTGNAAAPARRSGNAIGVAARITVDLRKSRRRIIIIEE